ncbi:MAG TPA: metallophosphoesterase [Thermoanaerobaculia bacterium]|nr:metallophosphoesterase [Thermoanaerobaculia bacterium]
MKNIDRRSFLRFSGLSLGAGTLLQFMPRSAGAGILDHFHRMNGEAPRPFSLIQLSDTHVGFKGPPDPLGTAAFERAVEVINGLDSQPDLVLFTGDLTHDSEDPAEHAQRMKKFREIASKLRVGTRYHVPGEHDAALDKGVLFRENFGETHYSFDHKGVHFVGIDNVSHGKPVVGAEQIDWLKKDLARYSKTTPIVVFTHRPLFDLKPDWEWFTGDGDKVMNVLAAFDAVTVLYGHIHRENHATLGNAQHHAARSLIFAFPDPSTAEKKPLPFDSTKPFQNLGIRTVSAPSPIGVRDVELTVREFTTSEGVTQLLKEGSYI